MQEYFDWSGYGAEVDNNCPSNDNTTTQSLQENVGYVQTTTLSSDHGFEEEQASGKCFSPRTKSTERRGQSPQLASPTNDMQKWHVIMDDLGVQKEPWDLSRSDLMNKKFASLENAEFFFYFYAQATGFSIRKGQKRVRCDGVVSVRDWCCSKEGHRRRTDKPSIVDGRERPPATRQGCKVQLRVIKEKNTNNWIVKEFFSQHSHPLACAEHVHFLRSTRVVSGGAVGTAAALRNVGVRTSQIMSFMAVQMGGYSKVPFTPKDLYNALQKQNEIQLADSDTAKAIGYLQHKADNDAGFFGKYSYDDNYRLENMIWADSRCRADYKAFGNALAFDTTYRSNRYGKPLLVLVGINHHYKTTIFGIALLKNETVETYQWALSAFVECMEGVRPLTVITDGDNAMRKAIQDVMPTSVHRLCTWHIQKNVISHVKDRKLVSHLKRFFTRPFTDEEFKIEWRSMLQKFDVQHHVWLESLYDRRRQWAQAYFKRDFFGGMTTTQRCEGMHWFVKSKGKSAIPLADFVRTFDMALSWLRYHEAKDDFDSQTTNPVIGITNMIAVETHCAQLYTRSIFQQVRREICKEGKYMAKVEGESHDGITVSLVKYGNPSSVTTVQYVKEQNVFLCECNLLLTKGLPCRHIFAVMKLMNMTEMPSSLIMKRWTKNAKSLSHDRSSKLEVLDTTTHHQATKFGMLTSRCAEVAFLASKNDSLYGLAEQHIGNLIQVLRDKLAEGKNPKAVDKAGVIREPAIKNPLQYKTKGSGVPLPNTSRRAKKCSACKSHGHNKKTCNKLAKRARPYDQIHDVDIDDSETISTRADQDTFSMSKSKPEAERESTPVPMSSAATANAEKQANPLSGSDYLDDISNNWWGRPYGLS